MLSFNVLGGGEDDRQKLKKFNNAITKTIELCCSVTHPGVDPMGNGGSVSVTGPDTYRKFWQCLIEWYSSARDFPTIITLNYDLVLERSLCQILINTVYGSGKNRLPFDQFTLEYGYSLVPRQQFRVELATFIGSEAGTKQGTLLKRMGESQKGVPIEIFKLHGSANFPSTNVADPLRYNFCSALSDPYIMPPISNKFVTGHGEGVWRRALRAGPVN